MTERMGNISNREHSAIFALQGDIIIFSKRDLSLLNTGHMGVLRKSSGEGVSIRRYTRNDLLEAIHNNPALARKIVKAIAERRIGHITDDNVLHLHEARAASMRKIGLERFVYKDTKSALQLQRTEGDEGVKLEGIQEKQYSEYFAEIMAILAGEATIQESSKDRATIQKDVPTTKTSGLDLSEPSLKPINKKSSKPQPIASSASEEDKITESVRSEKRKAWEDDQRKSNIAAEKIRKSIKKDQAHTEILKEVIKSEQHRYNVGK